MIVLIDAYNILKQILHAPHISQQERTTFIAQMHSYATMSKNRVILVFDGGHNGWQSQEKRDNLKIIYVGSHQTADDYIKAYIHLNQTKDILLVSSDHELNVYASNCRVPSMDSIEFIAFLRTRKNESAKFLKSYDKIIPLTPPDNQELATLLEQESHTVPLKEEIPYQDRSSKKHQLSKREKQLLQKTKKL